MGFSLSVIRDIQVNVDNCPRNDIPSLTGLMYLILTIQIQLFVLEQH